MSSKCEHFNRFKSLAILNKNVTVRDEQCPGRGEWDVKEDHLDVVLERGRDFAKQRTGK